PSHGEARKEREELIPETLFPDALALHRFGFDDQLFLMRQFRKLLCGGTHYLQPLGDGEIADGGRDSDARPGISPDVIAPIRHRLSAADNAFHVVGQLATDLRHFAQDLLARLLLLHLRAPSAYVFRNLPTVSGSDL